MNISQKDNFKRRQMIQPPKRIQWIDALKGVGILMVIWAHIGSVTCGLFWYFTYAFMPIFYVASGFTSKSVVLDFKNYIKKKTSRLLIPYFMYAFIFIFLLALIEKDFNLLPKIYGIIYGRYSLYRLDSAENVYFLGSCRNDIIAPLWFLPSLFLAYIWLYLYDNIQQKKMLLAVYGLITIICTFYSVLLPWSLDTSFMAFFFILVGRKLKNTVIEMKFIIGLCLGVLYLILCKINGPTNFSIANYGKCGLLSLPIFFIMGIIEPLFISVICEKWENNVVIKVLAYLGRQSLRLMCIHIFVYRIIYESVENISGIHNLSFCIGFTAIFAVNYILGKLFERYSNKIVILNYL